MIMLLFTIYVVLLWQVETLLMENFICIQFFSSQTGFFYFNPAYLKFRTKSEENVNQNEL